MTKRRNDDAQRIVFASRDMWRKWLKANHNKATGVWMVHLKGKRAKECIAYEDAIEEALCWGWIDSIIKKVDDEKYLRKFTPRQPGSIWSELNKDRIARMVKAGLMREAGLARIAAAKKRGDWEKDSAPANGLSDLPEFAKALAASRKARQYFEGLAPSYKRQFLGWIGSAKQVQTRDKRIKEALRLLRQEKRLGMK